MVYSFNQYKNSNHMTPPTLLAFITSPCFSFSLCVYPQRIPYSSSTLLNLHLCPCLPNYSFLTMLKSKINFFYLFIFCVIWYYYPPTLFPIDKINNKIWNQTRKIIDVSTKFQWKSSTRLLLFTLI